MEDRPTENPVLGCKQHDGQIPKPRILHAMQPALGWVRSNILPIEMGDVYVYLHAHFLHNDTQTTTKKDLIVRSDEQKRVLSNLKCADTQVYHKTNKQTNKKLKKNC